MGRSLISSIVDANELENVVSVVLRDPKRREEVDEILNDCRDRVRNLLLKKRHVVEGVRDALLEREELVGDEIEVLMAELGEREPIEVPVTGNGGRSPFGVAEGPSGNGPSGNGGGAGGGNGPTPPRPDATSGPASDT